MQRIRPVPSPACRSGGRRSRWSTAILAAVISLASLVGRPLVAAPWGWAPAGQAAAAWTPQNLADYLLTGQTPRPAVARIVAPEQSSTSLGSGVLVDVNRTQGLVLTNWHVVRDSRSAVLVQFPDGFQSAGTVVRWDEAWDLAALVIWKPTATPVPIAAAPPAVGDTLTIAGFGRGPYREETGPCLDYLSPGTGYPREFLELQATARQGDSGGPIFNARGELAGVLFGQADGRTIGSCSARVREFLAAVGSQGFVPRPIAEFSDARAIDRGIGLAAAAPERIADLGDQPLQRSAQVDGPAGLPVAAVAVALPSPPAAGSPQPVAAPPPAWPQWPAAATSKGPDLLAAAGGLALVVLGLRVLLGGRRRDAFPT
ncbi:MAG: hypothetical protein RLZZ440_1196 [Planctomycetota bacterium]